MNLNQLDIEDVTICLDAILQIGQHHKKFKPESTIGIREWINELGKGYLTDGQINAILTNCKIHKVDVPDCLRAWKEDQDEKARERALAQRGEAIDPSDSLEDLRRQLRNKELAGIATGPLPVQPVPQKPELSDLIALCEHVKEAAMAIATALRNQK